MLASNGLGPEEVDLLINFLPALHGPMLKRFVSSDVTADQSFPKIGSPKSANPKSPAQEAPNFAATSTGQVADGATSLGKSQCAIVIEVNGDACFRARR
jgi:hypothetical protein